MWAFAPGAEAKLDEHIVKSAPMQKSGRLNDIYGAEAAEVVLAQTLGWRSMHSQARGLNSVMINQLGARRLDTYNAARGRVRLQRDRRRLQPSATATCTDHKLIAAIQDALPVRARRVSSWCGVESEAGRQTAASGTGLMDAAVVASSKRGQLGPSPTRWAWRHAVAAQRPRSRPRVA